MIMTEMKYKKTGIHWMTEVPEHWEIVRLKWVLRTGEGIKIGPFGSSLKLEDLDDNGIRVYGQENVIKDDFSLGKRFLSKDKFEELSVYEVFPNDILVTMMGTTGKCKLVPEDAEKGIMDSHLIRLRANNKIRPSFLSVLINDSIQLKFQMSTDSKGSIMSGLNSKIVKNLFLPLPPIEEQDIILETLSTEFAKITRFIQTKQRFIELLKEQRQSIITNAVTKGIDDDVKMKESVLNKIPEHWEVRRLKFLAEVNFSTVDKHSHKEEKQVRLCNYVDVYKHEYITNDFNFMIATATDAEIKRFTVEKGDVIITKDSETAADIAIPALVVEDLENVVCAYHLAHIKPNRELIESEFLFRLFQSKKINSHFEVAAKGVTRHGLSYDDINSVFLPFPPTLKEQEEIIKHIKTESRTLDIAIGKAEREIELIKEYREAMIAEAVTGKMKL